MVVFGVTGLAGAGHDGVRLGVIWYGLAGYGQGRQAVA